MAVTVNAAIIDEKDTVVVAIEKINAGDEVIWRDNRNPIIPRNLLPTSNSIFNSAVVPFEGKFAGVFRVDDKERNMALHAGFSEDGIHWNINPTRIMFEQAEKSTEEVNQWGYGYDPRVCFIEDLSLIHISEPTRRS